MFEPSSKYSSNVSRALVALTMADGSVETFSVRLPLSNKINDALNSPDQFLDVLDAAGDQLFIAKADVKQVRLVDVPKANQLNLNRRSSDRAAFDPYGVLKIKKDSSIEEIKQAYHALTRIYHPDRVSSLELPPEMVEYARAMQVRINLAYEQIGG